jgi:hypothetical protein
MRRRGRIVRYWIDQRFNQSADPTGHPANRFVQLQEANCVERTRRMVSGDAYLGDVYVMPMKPTGDWKYLAPDTNGYVEVERVCARKWGRDSIASDRLGAVASAYFDSRR